MLLVLLLQGLLLPLLLASPRPGEEVKTNSRHGEEVTFTLGGLGDITGVVGSTFTYANAPHSNRPLYKFRNIPYSQPFERFRQSKLWDPNQPLNEDGAYDATRTGPLCHQGDMDPDVYDALKDKMIIEVALEVDPVLALAIGILISMMNEIFKLPPEILGPLDGSKKVGDVLMDWLDIDLAVSEDCLHLAVSTPVKPEGSQNPNLPVMFFVHGGAFYAGTSIKMGAERLAAFDDVVVVSINYRVGPLGFMCLDTDEAAGNMGLLDMVTALEWVHQYVSYFGGDPNRITIFGESAGSAAIGHLLLSELTTGMFQQGIGQSGSALASWAFDEDPEKHALALADMLGCPKDEGVTEDQVVQCMRQLPAVNVSSAFKDYSNIGRAGGGLGFGGSTPCPQTKGERKFYTADQTPESLLHSGQYERVPIMFGANSHEGSYVYGEVYNKFFLPNNLTNDTEFLKIDLVHQLLQTTELGNSYPVEYLVEEAYFDEWQMGDLEAMQAGIIDLLGVFFLKGSSYEFVVESSDQGSKAFWYSFEYAAKQKSVFHTLFINADKKAGITDPGVCHADELMYLFDMELPLVLCDVAQITAAINECLDEDGMTLDIPCIQGPFHDKWLWCVTGELTDEEMAVSEILATMWTNFARTGDPGYGAKQWSRDEPWYSRITTQVEQKLDYRKTYHIAADDNDKSTTPAPAPCEAGWKRIEIPQKAGAPVVECVLLGDTAERVTKEDAEYICSGHGAHLAEISDGHPGQVNNFLKNLIHDADEGGSWFDPGPHYEEQWWLGATCNGHHSSHDWGHWTWDNSGAELTYFDWLNGQPNDFDTENCLAFVADYGPFGSYNLHWNDWGCDSLARYICMKRGV